MSGGNGEVIKESLISFICEHCGGQREEIVSTLDEIILNYVVQVLEDALDLKRRRKQEPFDVLELSEMVSAYFPCFVDIPNQVVVDWVDLLVKEMMDEEGKKEEEEISIVQEKLSSVLRMIPDQGSGSRTSSVSTDEEAELLSMSASAESKRKRTSSSTSTDSNSPQFQTLSEMFPNYTSQEIGVVLSLANGDMERAVQILLMDDVEGGGLLRHGGNGQNGKKKDLGNGEVGEGSMKGLKDRLVARYGFVDKSEDGREFRPILPKEEPKKLVRYRDGQIVSTKGERFTEVAVTSTGEEVKIRSYLSRSQRQAIAEGRQPN